MNRHSRAQEFSHVVWCGPWSALGAAMGDLDSLLGAFRVLLEAAVPGSAVADALAAAVPSF